MRNADYSHPALGSIHMQAAIATLLRRRKHPMTEAQLRRWFYETPRRTISDALNKLAVRGTIDARATSLSRRRRVLEYTTPDGPYRTEADN